MSQKLLNMIYSRGFKDDVNEYVKYDIYKYFAPDSFQILLLTESKQIIVSCIILTVLIIIGVVNRKILFERRLDCGQK